MILADINYLYSGSFDPKRQKIRKSYRKTGNFSEKGLYNKEYGFPYFRIVLCSDENQEERKKYMKKSIILSALAVLVILFMMSLTAAAQTDTAGNVFISDDNPTQQSVGKDLYWAGSGRTFNGYEIGKSFLAAGRDITVSDSTIGGSLRAAGYSVTINGVDVEDNITAAGYNLQMSGVTASGVYAAASTVYFNGTADCVSLAGGTVTLDGEIRGDAEILAGTVILGENLQVDGTLTVKAENEPALSEGAKVGNLVFEKTETAGDIDEATGKVKEKASSSGFGKFVRDLLGALLLAALICLLLGGEKLSKPGEMLLSRPVPMLVTGFAAIFVLPGIILILFLIGIGSNSAALLILLYTIAAFCAVTFTGMTLAKTLLPRFTDNKTLNNEWICSLIGACVFWILRKIPVLGWIILFGSVTYTLGYFIQSVYLRLKGNKPSEIKGGLNVTPQEDILEPVGAAETDEPEISIIDEAVKENETEEIPAVNEAEPEAESEADAELEAESETETEAEAEDPKDPEETSAS